MSHFCVLVIGEEDLEKQLQPFHEFECTGVNDEYVLDLNITKEVKEAWEIATRTMYRGLDGELYAWDDERFYREPTDEERKIIGPIPGSGCGHGLSWSCREWSNGKKYETRVRHIPDGFTEENIKEENLAEWIEDNYGLVAIAEGEEPDREDMHKYGFAVVDSEGNLIKAIDRTNPNKKWDWYQVGGRYCGFYKIKEGAEGLTGDPGVSIGFRVERPQKGRADVVRKGDVDIEGMRAEAMKDAAEEFDAYADCFAGKTFPSWDAIREKHSGNIDAAREEYRDDPVVKAIRERDSERGAFSMSSPEERFCNGDRDAMLARARTTAGVAFAYLKDGVWNERGTMGWWGIVTNDEGKKSWSQKWQEMFDALPDDTLLTIVDCHI